MCVLLQVHTDNKCCPKSDFVCPRISYQLATSELVSASRCGSGGVQYVSHVHRGNLSFCLPATRGQRDLFVGSRRDKNTVRRHASTSEKSLTTCLSTLHRSLLRWTWKVLFFALSERSEWDVSAASLFLRAVFFRSEHQVCRSSG